MTDEATPSPAPKRRRKAVTVGPWPVAAAFQVLERYGVSTLALIALAWFTAHYMIRPLVDAAKASMESVADKVGAIEEIFRESERIERDQSVRSTAAIEAIKTEIAIHRQQAAEMRDGVLVKMLDAQSKAFSNHEAQMERLLRESLRNDGADCELPPGRFRGIFVGPDEQPAPEKTNGGG